MRVVAESFAWPFRGAWRGAWAIGLVTVLLVLLLFVPLLGYAVAATRAAEQRSDGPPTWRFEPRLFTDGIWTAFAVLVTIVPFAAAFVALSHRVNGISLAVVFFVLLFFWGLVALIFLPHATAAFAASGRPADLFDVTAAVRGVGRDFPTWNTVVAAIVTAWAIALACVALLCVGIVPGVFYAILVSAHAAAALHDGQGSRPGSAAR